MARKPVGNRPANTAGATLVKLATRMPNAARTATSIAVDRCASSSRNRGTTAISSAAAPRLDMRASPRRSAAAPNVKHPHTNRMFSMSEAPKAWVAVNPKAVCT